MSLPMPAPRAENPDLVAQTEALVEFDAINPVSPVPDCALYLAIRISDLLPTTEGAPS